MKLEWIGHACFRITAADGSCVITDPYDESVGIAMIPLRADLITMSHAHHDHCERSMIKGNPLIVTGITQAEAGSIRTYALMSWHDDQKGALRGENAVRIFEVDGLKIVHMGDQGCMPEEKALEEMAGTDILLIPAGGVYTADAREAVRIANRIKPRCVIPMHVKTGAVRYPIDPVDRFLDEAGMRHAVPLRVLCCMKETVPDGVVLMEPLADRLRA